MALPHGLLISSTSSLSHPPHLFLRSSPPLSLSPHPLHFLLRSTSLLSISSRTASTEPTGRGANPPPPRHPQPQTKHSLGRERQAWCSITPPTNSKLAHEARVPGLGSCHERNRQGRGMSARCLALSQGTDASLNATSASAEYKPTPLDDFFLMLFRRKLAKETGWKSERRGYEGMIDEAKHLLAMSRQREDAEAAAVRILVSFFPPGLLPLFKRFIAPALDGKLGPILSAQVTLVTCQWLMGPSKASQVDLPDASSLQCGVKIDKCRFLEETKCVGSCIHTCKMPTQAFMWEHMGVPLYMEPNLEDFSCEFKFGVPAPPRAQDPVLTKPCLAICPSAASRRQPTETCPEVLR